MRKGRFKILFSNERDIAEYNEKSRREDRLEKIRKHYL
jgi:hypothetical protein